MITWWSWQTGDVLQLLSVASYQQKWTEEHREKLSLQPLHIVSREGSKTLAPPGRSWKHYKVMCDVICFWSLKTRFRSHLDYYSITLLWRAGSLAGTCYLANSAILCCSVQWTCCRLTHKPAIITFLHHIDDVSFFQFQLILVAWHVSIQGLKSSGLYIQTVRSMWDRTSLSNFHNWSCRKYNVKTIRHNPATNKQCTGLQWGSFGISKKLWHSRFSTTFQIILCWTLREREEKKTGLI